MVISDQVDSYLEVITFSIKSLAYRIPLASCFGGHSVIPKSCHQHVIRPLTPLFSLNPKHWSENSALDVDLTYKTPAPLLALS